MSLSIPGFPHAKFDERSGFGYLVHYYPFDAVKKSNLSEDQWRNQSYSPEVLNFKTGYPNYLRVFKAPFLKLIGHSLQQIGEMKALLVPIPSSIASGDPKFKKTPRQKGERRNRDDRNAVFCNELARGNTRLRVLDCIVRVGAKAEKETWTEAQHAKSMAMNTEMKLPRDDYSGVFVLMDDVATGGGTLKGARKVLQTAFPNAKVIML
ncbi:MAG: hypothetical protein HYR96_04420, partial [Deltaproteobacteria bacterium]|nr:hypothetical protein [Deltaproteobacteria bacterium]